MLRRLVVGLGMVSMLAFGCGGPDENGMCTEFYCYQWSTYGGTAKCVVGRPIQVPCKDKAVVR